MNEPGRNWRIVYKCLVLLEGILRHGSERAIDEARDRLFTLRALQDFRFMEEERDRGSGIREKSKELVELLSDESKLRAVRQEASKNKGKYVGVSNAGSSRGFGSDSYSSGGGGGGGYDSGRYGGGGGGGGGSRYEGGGSSAYDSYGKFS